ncbi:MAG: monofunctional biosynthetic peptidoglycan transglycosylase [Chromatiales bacterium]
MAIRPDPDGAHRRRLGAARRRRRWWFRPGRWLISIVLIFVAVTAGPVFLLRFVDPPTTAFMLRGKWEAFRAGRDDYRTRYLWLDWDRISSHAALAVVAAEDQNFPRHYGFDLGAVRKAWETNRRGKRLRGASTISQQVAKNLFLWPGKSFLRKGSEAYFTTLIELLWPKRRILEVYLNIAQLGDGVYGVAAAADRYYQKPAASLSASEAALLAAVLPNPVRLHADRPSAYVLARRNWILTQMQQLGGTAYVADL